MTGRVAFGWREVRLRLPWALASIPCRPPPPSAKRAAEKPRAACSPHAVLAAVAKHEQSGWRWARSDNVALLVAERAYGGARSLFAFRMWAAESPWLCGALAKASMLVEAARVA